MNTFSLNIARNPRRSLDAGLIQPVQSGETDSSCPRKPHDGQPLKRPEDIRRIKQYLLDHCRYRDYLYFIISINTGLRVSDIRELRFKDFIGCDEEGSYYKNELDVWEIKTRSTKAKPKIRHISISNAIKDALDLYLHHLDFMPTLEDYVLSSGKSRAANTPMNKKTFYRILQDIKEELNLDMRFSTHSLRKTFCYWAMVDADFSEKRLLLLQRMLNHSSATITLEYIGLAQAEMNEVYTSVNLGASDESDISYREEQKIRKARLNELANDHILDSCIIDTPNRAISDRVLNQHQNNCLPDEESVPCLLA